MKNCTLIFAIGVAALCGHVAGAPKKKPLPLPEVNLPVAPAYPPSLITPRGQRRLIAGLNVKVKYDTPTRRLSSNYSSCWLINYPLTRIQGFEGKTNNEIAKRLFGVPWAELKNWYIKCPGAPPVEPPKPTYPAPIELHKATIVVNQTAPGASDSGPGTALHPLKTIGAAMKRAKAGDVVHIHPGIYRESIIFEKSGTLEKPIRIEGVRTVDGAMPVITGNDLFPANSWTEVEGLQDVYRAPIFTGQPGTVSMNGELMQERTIPQELKSGEYCFNYGDLEMVYPRVTPKKMKGVTWSRGVADGSGMLLVSDGKPDKVFYASTWVWIPPKKRKDGVVWDPRFPEPIGGKLSCMGEFRTFRMTGSSLGSQANPMRVWMNGELLPGPFVKGKPRAHSDYGYNENWANFNFKEGWNHLFFQFNTCTRKKNDTLRFKMGIPKGIDGMVCQAKAPADRLVKPGKIELSQYILEWMIAGPFSSKSDCSVYVRLPKGKTPADYTLDLSKRTSLAKVDKPFIHVRGLEFRHGAQFQQRAQLSMIAEGGLLEGCYFKQPEVRGVTISNGDRDQEQKPIIVRNNWVVSPGGLCFGSAAISTKLTPENQNTNAPGRGRFMAEYNYAIDNNRSGYNRWWESGGFKVFRMTRCIIRNNTIIGGDGPSIWLDWEHYNNRVEGNIAIDGTAFVVGVEASPGPNLVANNIAVNLRPGGVWFRAGILSWSSHRTWAAYNTLDGRWNKENGMWKGRTGTDGVFLHEGPANRNTVWGAVPKHQAAINNLILGSPLAIDGKWTDGSFRGGNVAAPDARDKTPELVKMGFSFLNKEACDYRLRHGQAVAAKAVKHEFAQYVTHDFYGLLRFPDQPGVGACRIEKIPLNPGLAQLEIELKNGQMKRLYKTRQ